MKKETEAETNKEQLIEPSYFVIGEKTYVYDYNELTVEQVELANEVAIFKADTMQNKATNFDELLRSKAADWFCIIGSYLLLEYDNIKKVVSPFNRDKAKSEVEFAVKTMKINDYQRLVACVEDFFTRLGKQAIILKLHSTNTERDKTGMLLQAIMSSMLTNKTT